MSKKRKLLDTPDNNFVFEDLTTNEVIQEILRKVQAGSQKIDLNENVQPCTRSYEETFLRQATTADIPCCKGKDCEGHKLLVDAEFHCTLVSFCLPNQSPSADNMCLLCTRLFALQSLMQQQHFAEHAHLNDKFVENEVLDSVGYYNLVDIPGEYSSKDIISFYIAQNKVAPIKPLVLHRRSAYSASRINGTIVIHQTGYKSIEAEAAESSKNESGV